MESSFKDFLYIVENFDGTPVDFFINHFFVFGKIQNWGIYICEYPTINIIGCTRDIKDKFQEAFKIEGNGL